MGILAVIANKEKDMRKFYLLLLTIFTFITLSLTSGQSGHAETDQSIDQFQQWAKNLAAFVKDVRFNEQDVQDMIRQWNDFNAFGEKNAVEDEEYLDFKSVLADSAYRTWAESKGINSETWLKKTMRIMAMIMRDEIEKSKSQGNFDMTTQLANIEEMRAQVGEEMYQQMKQAMEAGAQAMKSVTDSCKELPLPTDEEKTLLAKYTEQLKNLN